MPTRERPRDRGRRLARSDLVRLGTDVRQARLALGRSIRAVAGTAGLSPSQAGRLERAELPGASLDQLARLGAAVGLDVRLRAYPGPDPVRDAGQISLLERLKTKLPEDVRFPTEVPLARDLDQRAWDAVIKGLVGDDGGLSDLPVEAETRITDVQGQFRRITLKLRDAGFPFVLVLVSDTTRNRRAIGYADALLAEQFPVSPRDALAALRAGRHPGGSSIIFL